MKVSAIPFAVIVFLSAMTAVAAEQLRIVAIGASNTQGWYVGKQGAYPAKLQALLKAKGVDAQVINAGVPLDTTAGMLKRIDRDVPVGTDIVILQPGANDLRFFVTKEERAANIAAMERRLRERSIKVIVYDEVIPLRYYTFDFIHLTGEGHAMIAAKLLPWIMATINRRAVDAKPSMGRGLCASDRNNIRSRHNGLAAKVHYAAAKAGVVGMIKSIAQESAERGVTANCIAPGFLAIPMAGVSYSPSQSEAFLASIPAGRFESASEIAAAAVFLASDEAAYVTGQPLHINGGLARI
jgi:acyl-CoA thioesterase I